MTASPPTRYRLDDLRRLATHLTSLAGVPPARAAALASHLLWFDAAGASSLGIASLPTWLERIESKEIDPVAAGKVVLEHSGTAVFDAQRGLGPLALATAAGIASEKARDVGIGVVRVRNIGPTGPSAPIAAGLAIGPFASVVAGPAPSIAMALPTAEGLPAIYDSELGQGTEPAGKSSQAPEGWLEGFAPWVGALAESDGFLILALSIPAMETLTGFHDRATKLLQARSGVLGPLWPETLAARREEARERGVTLDPAATTSLQGLAGRWDVPWPGDLAG